MDVHTSVVTIFAPARALFLESVMVTKFFVKSRIFEFGSYPLGQKIDNSKQRICAAYI
jgi:hypothetical protein